MKPEDFPSLKQYVGQDLVVTDGLTLLGGDDKAGVAEIMTAAEYLINHPEIPHGPIRVGFTPDEEVGQGADYFDVKNSGLISPILLMAANVENWNMKTSMLPAFL